MMKKHLLSLLVWVLLCGHFSVWAGINEDLLAAAKAGKSEEVERLLGERADVSTQDSGGLTPLHWAAGSSSLSDMMLNRPFFPVGWENLILIS